MVHCMEAGEACELHHAEQRRELLWLNQGQCYYCYELGEEVMSELAACVTSNELQNLKGHKRCVDRGIEEFARKSKG